MIVQKAPVDRRIRLVDITDGPSQGEIRHAHPVDAREMIACGAYKLANEEIPLEQQATDAPAPDSSLVPIDKLAAYLDKIEDGDALLTLEGSDPRPEAKPIYEARFNVLASNPPAPRL